MLESYLRAAMAAIEARTGKVLLSAEFVLDADRLARAGRQALPVAPVQSVTEVKIVDRAGATTVVDPARYRLEPDRQRPRLVAIGLHLPLIPVHGSVEIGFIAGYRRRTGSDLPADLGSGGVPAGGALLREPRRGDRWRAAMPFGVSLLIDRYRTVRLFGEGAR